MFDCGMHMGYSDERRFPDFSYLSQTGDFDSVLDCVLVTHFHLDHCGALPYFVETCGYNGPVYMTHPTRAICPILLEDYRKIVTEKRQTANFFTSDDIRGCMKKVTPINLHESVFLGPDCKIKAYYAGHVLGAVMFHVRVGSESVVYTGDYNMTPDRHLGAAWIDRVKPDVLITETTYGTTLRGSRRARERDFLRRVHECVEKGGKVLIPAFALGRVQELCILVEMYWERMNLQVPVYFSAGLTERANRFYRLYINWTNQKIKKTFVERNMFEFKHIKPLERRLVDADGPMVIFASPGMLHSGTSLEIFKKLAPDEKNMVVIPGYCVAGTVGAKILAGAKTVEVDRTTVPVNLQIANLSFSAHADARGIVQLISQCDPSNIVFVHGEKSKMQQLGVRITRELGIPCFDPPNGALLCIETVHPVPVRLASEIMSRLVEKPSLEVMERLSQSLEESSEDSVVEFKTQVFSALGVLHNSISFNARMTIGDQVCLHASSE